MALYQEGKETYHSERAIGETVTEQDIMLRSLHLALDMLTPLLDSQPAQQHKPITIAAASEITIKRALDTSPHGDRAESIKLLERFSTLLDKYPTTNITLQWLPRRSQFIGFQRTKQLALEASRTADLTAVSKPQTLDNQLKQAETAAIEAWAKRYNQAPLMSMAY